MTHGGLLLTHYKTQTLNAPLLFGIPPYIMDTPQKNRLMAVFFKQSNAQI
jgi:hypothetical protein